MWGQAVVMLSGSGSREEGETELRTGECGTATPSSACIPPGSAQLPGLREGACDHLRTGGSLQYMLLEGEEN